MKGAKAIDSIPILPVRTGATHNRGASQRNNASWTLRADWVADFVVTLLRRMRDHQVRKVVPTLRRSESDMPRQPRIDPENFNPGYVTRDRHLLPKAGSAPEWQHTQDYWTEKDQIPAIGLVSAPLKFR